MSKKKLDFFKDKGLSVELIHTAKGNIHLLFTAEPLLSRIIEEKEIKEIIDKRGYWEDIIRDKSHLEGKDYQERLNILDWDWKIINSEHCSVLVDIHPPSRETSVILGEDVENVGEVLKNIRKYELHIKVKKNL